MNQKEERAGPHHAVRRIISGVLEKADGRRCIFRGESMHHERCSSSLYREMPEGSGEDRHASSLQKMYRELIIEDAGRYVESEKEEDILAKVRHYGGFTNLIDFTGNCLVALFFACRGNLDEDGRLIVFSEADRKRKYAVLVPGIRDGRVLVQSSVFIEAPKGCIDDGDLEIITVRREDKEDISVYLSRFHSISEKTMFDDLHGVIERQGKILKSALPFRRGVQADEREDWNESIRQFTEAVSINPRFPLAYNNRGLAYSSQDSYEQAISDYSRAIELDPGYAEAYNNRGDAHSSQGSYEQAIADYTKVIELDPECAESYNNRGLARRNQGNYQQAIADHTRAIELDPRYAAAYNNRGLACSGKGDYEQAIADHARAIELFPGFAEAYCNRGRAYRLANKHKEATADYNECERLAREQNLSYLLAKVRGTKRLLK